MRVLQVCELPVNEIAPFGNIDLGVSVDRFFTMGFCPGDAVDVEFSNGFAFRNIPVFSGFYGDGDMPCLYASISLYPHVGIGCPVSGNPWRMAGVKLGDTACITLRSRQSFEQLEKSMCLPELRGLAPCRAPQQSANWRSLAGGRIALGLIYRSCSPIRDDVSAADTACALMNEAGIQAVLNLSDSPTLMEAGKMREPAGTSPYLRLYDENRVLLLHLGVDFRLQENARSLAQGLLWLASQPKPALVHCKLGLDRTGTVCVLLEMLAGGDYADISRDYRTSYFNLFGPPPQGEQGYPLCDLRFKELVDFLLSLVQGEKSSDSYPGVAVGAEDAQNDVANIAQIAPDSETLRRAARAYLGFGGLSDEEIDLIESWLECARVDGGGVSR